MSRSTPPSERDAIIWRCPTCKASSGSRCVDADGSPRSTLHRARYDFARRHPTRSLTHLARRFF